jgi:hypothetical protein
MICRELTRKASQNMRDVRREFASTTGRAAQAARALQRKKSAPFRGKI